MHRLIVIFCVCCSLQVQGQKGHSCTNDLDLKYPESFLENIRTKAYLSGNIGMLYLSQPRSEAWVYAKAITGIAFEWFVAGPSLNYNSWSKSYARHPEGKPRQVVTEYEDNLSVGIFIGIDHDDIPISLGYEWGKTKSQKYNLIYIGFGKEKEGRRFMIHTNMPFEEPAGIGIGFSKKF